MRQNKLLQPQVAPTYMVLWITEHLKKTQQLIMITYTRKSIYLMQEVHAMELTFSDALIIRTVIISHYF